MRIFRGAGASLSVLAACLLGSGSTQAGDVLYVLDVSGSMACPVQSSSAGHFESLLSQAVSQLRSDLSGLSLSGGKAGLIAFGHRRTGCEDIERIAPVGSPTSPMILGFLEQVHPGGATPLAASLDLAKTELEKAPKGTRIVVLSDGGDNCGGSAERAASALKAAHPESRIDVQFYSVSGASVPPSVERVARAGGGGVSVLRYEGGSGGFLTPGFSSSRGGRQRPNGDSAWEGGAQVPGAFYQVGVRAPISAQALAAEVAQKGPREGVDYPIYDPEEKLPALRFGKVAPRDEPPVPKAVEAKSPEPEPSARPHPSEVREEQQPPAVGQLF